MHTDWFVFSTSESSGVGCGGESGPILDVVARAHNLIGVDVFLPSLVVILALKTMPKDAAPDVMPDLRMCNLFDTSGKVRQWDSKYSRATTDCASDWRRLWFGQKYVINLWNTYMHAHMESMLTIK